MDLTWMAWTWPTAVFFAVVAVSIAAMGVWERVSPGGGARRGCLGLHTTRGDRLFISWLGTGFIGLGWLAAFGSPLWGALALALIWWFFVFRWV